MRDKKEKYDIFISYRRDGADQTAKAIYDKLIAKGYNVFYDIEALRSGDFNKELYKKIEECQDFILILPPNGLDRCNEEDDWVRLEIEHALKYDKNIIPVMLRGFEFPNELPREIEPIRVQNGLVADVTYFDAVIDKMCKFLKTKVSLIKRFMAKSITSKVLYGVASIAIVIMLFLGGKYAIETMQSLKVYPSTSQEENDVSEMIYNVQTNLSVVENLNSSMLRVLDSCDAYIDGEYTYDDLTLIFEDAEKQMDFALTNIDEIDGDLKKSLKSNNIDVASLISIPQYINNFDYEYRGNINFLKMEMDGAYGYTKSAQEKLIDLKRNSVEINSKIMILGASDLLIPISDEAKEEFLKMSLPQMLVLSQYLYLWSDDSASINAQMNQLFEQQENDLIEYAKLVGEGSKEVANLEKTIEQQETEIISKYSAKEGDSESELWLKALTFLSIGFDEQAINVFNYYIENIDDGYNPEVYVSYAIEFVKQKQKLGIDYGSLVFAYEQGKPEHSVFEIGDIIIAANGEECRTFTEFAEIRDTMADVGYSVTVLRMDSKREYQKIDFEIPVGENIIGVLPLNLE